MISPFAPAVSTQMFAASYAQADAAFCQLAQRLSTSLISTEHPAFGPNKELLFTRHLWLGSNDAANVLVLMSGTHGVEGLAGSAIQQDLLSQIIKTQWQPAQHTALLIVHLLNPYGCAWLRRCEQNGIDLNRNFVDFNQSLPTNEGYDQLRDVLLFGSEAQRKQAQTDYAKQHGQTALEVAVSGGQYTDPLGPWFGGKAPAFARQYIESLMADYQLSERNLAVIDLHTGLGPFGHGEIICDHATASRGAQVAHQWYGEAVTLPDLGTSFSAPKVGLMDYAWHNIMRGNSCFVTLEFGTGSTERLFRVLLNDHALHANGKVDWQAPATQQVKKAMLEHFYPNDNDWRQAVMLSSRRVMSRALQGLAASVEGSRHV